MQHGLYTADYSGTRRLMSDTNSFRTTRASKCKLWFSNRLWEIYRENKGKGIALGFWSARSVYLGGTKRANKGCVSTPASLCQTLRKLLKYIHIKNAPWKSVYSTFDSLTHNSDSGSRRNEGPFEAASRSNYCSRRASFSYSSHHMRKDAKIVLLRGNNVHLRGRSMTFVTEAAVDEGGPTQEFLSRFSWCCAQQNSLFAWSLKNRVVRHNWVTDKVLPHYWPADFLIIRSFTTVLCKTCSWVFPG